MDNSTFKDISSSTDVVFSVLSQNMNILEKTQCNSFHYKALFVNRHGQGCQVRVHTNLSYVNIINMHGSLRGFN